ncbi:hypothetical protein EOPP23_06260 [Endozoicomonas sp. OPT23]|uniref:BamA/TamA family outer membrane protein n=1 Tax=Endozoicomonas sp. OPT23 TaxID=2072845 RepID=UPI00129A3AFC|nr:BamA/TamA family outer membrane protein [Endozoicomonas sp. OPT23]MRI32589.1 hypothetical protein [Endozoicomonas sp. OPT23]
MSSSVRNFALGALAAAISLGVLADDAVKAEQKGMDGIEWKLPAGPMYDPDFDFALAAIPTAAYKLDENSRDSFTKLTMVYGSNDNWNVGLETDNFFINDKVRFLNYVGYTDASFNRNIVGMGLQQLATTTISDWGNLSYEVIDNIYAGVSWNYSITEFDRDGTNPSSMLAKYRPDVTSTAYGLFLNYNTRNSEFFPTSGSYVKLDLQKTSLEKEKAAIPTENGDFDFNTLKLDARYYYPLAEQTTLALRGGLLMNSSDAPKTATTLMNVVRNFHGLTREVQARGGVTGEINVRHWFNDKWGMSAGLTVAQGLDTNEAKKDGIYKVAMVGLRYKLIPESNLSLRIDVTQSNQDDENSLLFFRVGEAF